MNKIKIIMLLMIASLMTFFSACDQDKGKSTVDFTYYYDAKEKNLVHFNAKGSSDYGTFQFNWDFGDGIFGDGKDISHSFSEFGKYTIKLNADIPESNVSTSVSKTINIEPPKISDLDFDIHYDPQKKDTVHFNAKGKSSDGEIIFTWDFGDGYKETGQDVTHTFGEFKKYKVTLSAFVAGSKIGTKISKDIALNSPEITNLDFVFYYDPIDRTKVMFTAQGNSSFGELEYTWDFGDGFTSNGINTQHTYRTYGKYNVRLQAKVGKADTFKEITKEIILEEPKISDINFVITPDKRSAKLFHFKAESSNSFGKVNYTWDFGDGLVATGDRVSNEFDYFGFYDVVLTGNIGNDESYKTDITKQIEVKAPEIKELKILDIQDKSDPLIIHFDALATATWGELEYEWNFGDTRIDIVKETSNKYADFGDKIVTLTVKIKGTDVSKTIKKTVEVVKPSFKSYKITSEPIVDDPLSVQFRLIEDQEANEANKNLLDAEFVEWDFGDEKLSGKNVTHRYTSYSDNKNVVLTLRNKNNVSKVLVYEFALKTPELILNKPTMLSRSLSDPTKIIFMASSESKFEDEVEYTWVFSDGTTKKGARVEIIRNEWVNPYTDIVEEVKLSASIPRLNIKVDPIITTFNIAPPKLNFNIVCNMDTKNKLKQICSIKNEKLDIGKVEYTWVFNEETSIIGPRASYTYPNFNSNAIVSVTAHILDTNIYIPKDLPVNIEDGQSFLSCEDASQNPDDENYLTVKCEFKYDKNSHRGTHFYWEMGDGKTFNGDDVAIVSHKYAKGGKYTVTLKFDSLSTESGEETYKADVVYMPIYNMWWNSGPSVKTGMYNGIIRKKYTVGISTNIESFNKSQFTAKNVFNNKTNLECTDKWGNHLFSTTAFYSTLGDNCWAKNEKNSLAINMTTGIILKDCNRNIYKKDKITGTQKINKSLCEQSSSINW